MSLRTHRWDRRADDEPIPRSLVLGGGYVGATLANHLGRAADAVVFLDAHPRAVEYAEQRGVSAHVADVTSARELDRHADEDADLAVVASESDSTNLLVAQLLRVRFDVERVVVRINDPRNLDSFETLDVETVCASSVLAERFGETLGVEETLDVEETNSDSVRELA